MSRRSWIATPIFVLVVALLSGCAGSARYTMIDLNEGVEVAVALDDESGLVESAFLVSSDRLGAGADLSRLVGAEGPVAVDGAGTSFDLLVAYTAGPFCGIPPSMTVTGDAMHVDIRIETRQAGACDAMQYVEVIGLALTDIPATVAVTVE